MRIHQPVQPEWPIFSPAQPHTQEDVEKHAARLDAEAAAAEELEPEEAKEDLDIEISDKEP